jgi:hypothetical protein
VSRCIEWSKARNKHGYGVRWYRGKTWLAHRAEFDEKVRRLKEGEQVLHRCDNPPCIRLDHLFIGTPKVNAGDRVAKGRQTRGETHHTAKLSDREIQAIRSEYKGYGNPPQHVLAAKYGVDRSLISLIVNGRSR